MSRKSSHNGVFVTAENHLMKDLYNQLDYLALQPSHVLFYCFLFLKGVVFVRPIF